VSIREHFASKTLPVQINDLEGVQHGLRCAPNAFHRVRRFGNTTRPAPRGPRQPLRRAVATFSNTSDETPTRALQFSSRQILWGNTHYLYDNFLSLRYPRSPIRLCLLRCLNTLYTVLVRLLLRDINYTFFLLNVLKSRFMTVDRS
jgi:hypothetical protein